MDLRKGTIEDKIGKRIEVLHPITGVAMSCVVIGVNATEGVYVIPDGLSRTNPMPRPLTIKARNGVIHEPAELNRE